MGVSQKPAISLFLNYEPAVINATAEEVSLSFIVGQQEHRSWVPHSIWLQHRSDIHLASSISSYHGLQHCLRWQYRSQTPIRTLAAVQHTEVIMASGGSTSHRYRKAFGSNAGHGCGWTKDPDMASGVSRPQISPGPPAGVQDKHAHINTTSRHRHGSVSFHRICTTPLPHRPHCKLAWRSGTENCVALLGTLFCPHISACKCSWQGSGSRPLLSETP